MLREKYVVPELGLEAFNCPFCRAYSHQEWYEVVNRPNMNQSTILPDYGVQFLHPRRQKALKNNRNITGNEGAETKHINAFSECYSCKEIAIWQGTNMVYPNNLNVEPPNPDMPVEVQNLYNEARSIAALSVKAAAALLRLALEKLLVHIGAQIGTTDMMIQDLIDKGQITANGPVRKALDSLRLIGNAAVHTTGINLTEDPRMVPALFKVINFVVEKLITEEKEMEEIYALVPEGKREKLDNRRDK